MSKLSFVIIAYNKMKNNIGKSIDNIARKMQIDKKKRGEITTKIISQKNIDQTRYVLMVQIPPAPKTTTPLSSTRNLSSKYSLGPWTMSVLNITHIHKKSKELRTTDMDFSLLTHTCLFRFEVGTCMY